MEYFFSLGIENFLLIAEHKSLSAVSRKTGQDVGSLSRSLANLEKDLDKVLFVRLNTGLKLTQEGMALLAAVKAGKHSFQAELKKLNSPRIRIGFSASIGFSYFKAEYFKLLQTLDLSPEFHIRPTINLIEMLKTRELDFIIAPKKITLPECINVPLESDKIVLVSSTGKEAKILLYNSEMMEIENALKKVKFDKKWDVKDYFVLAKFLSLDIHHMGLLPSTLLESFPNLKTIREFSHIGKMQAISWKGSTGVKFLRALRNQ